MPHSAQASCILVKIGNERCNADSGRNPDLFFLPFIKYHVTEWAIHTDGRAHLHIIIQVLRKVAQNLDGHIDFVAVPTENGCGALSQGLFGRLSEDVLTGLIVERLVHRHLQFDDAVFEFSDAGDGAFVLVELDPLVEEQHIQRACHPDDAGHRCPDAQW